MVAIDVEADLPEPVFATKPSFVRTVNTSALLTGFVSTALKTVPSSVIEVRSCAAYDVTATIGVFWFALLVDLIIRAAFSPSTVSTLRSAWTSHRAWLHNSRIGMSMSMKMTSKVISPIEQRIASSPLWTTTHMHPSRCRMVSRILEEIGSKRQISYECLLDQSVKTHYLLQ